MTQPPDGKHVEPPLVGVRPLQQLPEERHVETPLVGIKPPQQPSDEKHVELPLVGVRPSQPPPDEQNGETPPMEVRLARFLAHAGIASRRHAEELIANGQVQVNGVTVTTQGRRIDPARDIVSVDGKPINAYTKHVYLLLHKPAGYVSTAHDPQGRPTVLDLLPPDLHRLRVYPVGRLDIDTSGLLLLTNDGDFALHLTHPRYSMEKHYHVLIQGCPNEAALAALRNGVTFTEDNGRSHTSALAQVNLLRQVGTNCWLSLTIHEGRKRQVRRMLAAIGYRVLQLIRVGIGPLRLDDIPVGKWRHLTDAELQSLKV